MRPHLSTGPQSSVTLPILLILFANLSTMKAGGSHNNEARSETNPDGFFPAFSVDKTEGTLNSISGQRMETFQRIKESAKTGNTTGPDDDVFVSDEAEDEDDEEEEGESYDEEEEDDDDESEEDEEVEEEEEEDNFQADVRSLSDLPLSRLLKVRGELQRIEAEEVAETRALGSSQPFLGNVATARTAALEAASAAAFNHLRNGHNAWPNNIPNGYQPTRLPINLPSGKKKAADLGESKDAPPRRGGWHFEEEEEEEEHEEEHNWISSWNKGKKKKGDIGSIFQISVTFLAFLAFGGYLLCLIVQAVKGGGPTGPTGDGYRPPVAPMVLMMPARLGVRRPRPPNPGRRRRRKRRRRRDASESPDDDVPWPTWSDPFEAEGSGRLWPNVDLKSLQRVLFDISRELAENGPILQ